MILWLYSTAKSEVISQHVSPMLMNLKVLLKETEYPLLFVPEEAICDIRSINDTCNPQTDMEHYSMARLPTTSSFDN